MTSIKGKKLAKKFGFELWWDERFRLWTLTKENTESQYLPSAILLSMSEDTFINYYLT